MIKILSIIIICAVLLCSGYIVYRNAASKRPPLKFIIPASIIMLLLVFTLNVFAVLIFILFCVGFLIYAGRSDKKKVLIYISCTAASLIMLFVFFNLYGRSQLQVASKAPEKYIMNMNETEYVNGTSIKLDKVLMDLRRISASYEVKGKSHVVAVEIKKNINDNEPLNYMAGLWIGKSIFSDYASFSIPYDSDEFLDPLYIVFYLSDGENTSFKIQDKVNVKDMAETISVNKTLNFNDKSFKVKKFIKGIDYSSLEFSSSIDPSRLNVELIEDGKTVNSGGAGWAGGFMGAFSFDPVYSNNLIIRITDKDTNITNELDLSKINNPA